jgi:hypothetical protein
MSSIVYRFLGNTAEETSWNAESWTADARESGAGSHAKGSDTGGKGAGKGGGKGGKGATAKPKNWKSEFYKKEDNKWYNGPDKDSIDLSVRKDLCVHFFGATGCNRGEKCRFKHTP